MSEGRSGKGLDLDLERFGTWVDSKSPAAVTIASTSGILALGVLDYLSGRQIVFSVFYLIPLAVVAWKVDRRLSYLLCVLAAGVWVAADLLSGDRYDHFWIPVWNTLSRLAVFLLVANLLSALREAVSAQRHLAQTDSLTGVASGREFNRAAVAAAEEARRTRQPLTIAYVDLDDFKKVNDTLGHAGGDRVLQLVAQGFEKLTRSSDTVGRLGGDEFGLVLPATGVRAASKVMGDLVTRVQKALSEFDWPVGLSAGAVTYLVPPPDPDQMIDLADGLMYEAKREGKGTFRHRVVGKGEPDAFPEEAPGRDPRQGNA